MIMIFCLSYVVSLGGLFALNVSLLSQTMEDIDGGESPGVLLAIIVNMGVVAFIFSILATLCWNYPQMCFGVLIGFVAFPVMAAVSKANREEEE